MKNLHQIFLLGLLIFLSSCGTQKKLEALQLNYQQCLENAAAKEGEINAQKARADGLIAQMELLKDQNISLKNSLENCITTSGSSQQNISQLIKQANASQEYIKRLTDARSKNDSLNLAISNKLKRSLDNIADDDVNIKVQKGVVFISLSDKMLYRSGSYDILPSAEAVLAKVAKVINDYSDYDVLIEGHTDSDPIRSSIIKDNWDLSALRATSVVRTLQNKFGVTPSRMTAGGRSEFLPKESNLTEAGKSANRRTEIIILPRLEEFMKLLDIKEKQ